MKTLFNFLLSIPQALFGGFIFAHLWNWFIVRKFPSMPNLTFLDAVGILIVVGFPLFSLHVGRMMQEVKKEKDVDSGTLGIITSLVTICILYPLMLGIAYVWHMVIGG